MFLVSLNKFTMEFKKLQMLGSGTINSLPEEDWAGWAVSVDGKEKVYHFFPIYCYTAWPANILQLIVAISLTWMTE